MGALRGADPRRGRFRDFLKGVLFHLIADFHRQRQRPRPQTLPDDGAVPAAAPDEAGESDRLFTESWREQLMARAWEALDADQAKNGRPLATVLRLRADHPDWSSAQLAGHLTERLGKPVAAPAARQLLHRAREKFVHLLVVEVLQTLRDPTMDQLEQELADLGLLEYCRPALKGKPKI